MIIRKIKILLLVVVMIITLNNIAMAQNYVNNLNSYLVSEKSSVSVYIDIKKMKLSFPDFKEKVEALINAQPKNDKNNVSKYYYDLKDAGIDLIETTDFIFGSIEEHPFDKSLYSKKSDDLNYMFALTGNYPIEPLRKYLKKEKFKETSTSQAITFTKEDENTAISIIKGQVIVITKIGNNKDIVNRIVTGKDLKKGKIEKFVNEAKAKYDLMFFVTELESIGPVNMKAFKKEYSSYLKEIEKLADEILFKSFSFGIQSDGKKGFKIEINIETALKGDSDALLAVVNQAMITVKFLGPVVIGSMSEDKKDGEGVDPMLADAPKLTKQQQKELTNFIYAITVTQTNNTITISLTFLESFLIVINEIMSKM